MKSSKEQVFVLLSSVSGLNADEYQSPDTINLKYTGIVPRDETATSFDFSPSLIRIFGPLNHVLCQAFNYVVGPHFEHQTGPLQPKDEQAFFDMRMKCEKLINQISEIVENTISQVQKRKQKENLTDRQI